MDGEERTVTAATGTRDHDDGRTSSNSAVIPACGHSWRFDGDDPRIVCVKCGELRDALTGRAIPNSATNDGCAHEWEAVGQIDRRCKRCGKVESGLEASQDWPHVGRTSPNRVLWEAFHAAIAIFGDESEQAATIFRIHREAEERT